MSIDKSSKYHEAYFNQVLNGIRAKGSLGKVFDIIEDISNRSGLGDVFNDIEARTQDEIIEKWQGILDTCELCGRKS